MSYVWSVVTSLDPLAILFLLGSLALLTGTLWVLFNPVDLRDPPEERARLQASSSDAGMRPSAPEELPPSPPSRPVKGPGRRAA